MNPRPFPWVYPYSEDLVSGSRHVDNRIVLRPVVPITLVGQDEDHEARVWGIVDSGAERTLAAPGLARQIGVNPDPNRRIHLGIGGDTRAVRFADVTLRLRPSEDAGPDDSVEWRTEVGFIEQWKPPWAVLLGQVGFFDNFTVTLSRLTQAFAIEAADEFERRFSKEITEAEQALLRRR
jgi:hypothetical protein